MFNTLQLLYAISVLALATAETSVESLLISSNIQSRFATTEITTKILNANETDQEVEFFVHLPSAAFISNYSMLIGDELILGKVKEKAQASQDYQQARSRGQSAGLVSHVPRESNTFRISVNVAPRSAVTFSLTYQELLRRVHGVYKHQINFNPGQTAKTMKVQVLIEEKKDITNILVPKVADKLGDKTNKKLLEEEQSPSITVDRDDLPDFHRVQVTWQPTAEEQQGFAATGAQMVVLYDVERDQSGGEIETVNGYFVHYFAPEGLQPGNKHVVFVLDRSGSMRGAKMNQLKQAMALILSDLKPTDKLSIVTFSDDVAVWKPMPIEANEGNVRNAKTFIQEMQATGGTNIHDALKAGIEFMHKHATDDILAPMVVFLTDGMPTSGRTSSEDILGGVNKWNKDDKHSVHAISFGNDADFDLIKKIAKQNKGLARKVYEDSDAELQLTGFYEEISSPALAAMEIKYLNETVDPDSIVNDNAMIYTIGSEVVTVGKVNKARFSAETPTLTLASQVTAQDASGERKVFGIRRPVPCWHICYPRYHALSCPRPFHRGANGLPENSTEADGQRTRRIRRCIMPPPCRFPCPPPPQLKPQYEPLPADTVGGFVERMWAYLTIRKLLDQSEYGGLSKDAKKQKKNKALEMSLKYQFVTELTSMVVVQPDAANATETSLDQVEPQETRGAGSYPVSVRRFGGRGGAVRRLGGGRGGFRSMSRQGRPGLSGPSGMHRMAGMPRPTRPGASRIYPTRSSSAQTLPYYTGSPDHFDLNWDTRSTVASSRDHCARQCKGEARCKFALFTPALNNCLMSFEGDVFACDKEDKKAEIQADDPVVIFCIT